MVLLSRFGYNVRQARDTNGEDLVCSITSLVGKELELVQELCTVLALEPNSLIGGGLSSNNCYSLILPDRMRSLAIRGRPLSRVAARLH